jgi:serine/threonine-protein kinase
VSSAPDPHAETQPVPHAPVVLSALREHEQERGVGARYEKLERLGAGGMAVVHRALDRKLGREVALKELREELGVSAEGLARFRREAEAVARLAHPNVVSFFDLVEEGPHVFLVMELVKGDPLSNLLAARKLDTRGVVLLLEKVARGVQHAHEHGVLHRDLKPGNVLVGVSGEPKVADFGLARLAGERTLTATGEILGTPAYMPPEQARGETVSERADVYALGAILYEALTGRPPFVADSMAALLQKVLNEEPASPRLLNAKVHVDLETIALRCLAREPERRYASAGLVADELARFLRGEPIVARPPSFASAPSSRSSGSEGASAPSSPSSRPWPPSPSPSASRRTGPATTPSSPRSPPSTPRSHGSGGRWSRRSSRASSTTRPRTTSGASTASSRTSIPDRSRSSSRPSTASRRRAPGRRATSTSR